MDQKVSQQQKQGQNDQQPRLHVMKQTQNLQGSNGCPLFVREWMPDGDLKGCLHILHGMAEHSERYDGFATYMAEEGYAVWVHDHRQHGYSVLHHSYGVYDKSDTWEAMVADVVVVQKAFHNRYPELPMTLLGHSMGSILLRSYLQNNKTNLKGAVIMGTPVTPTGLLKAAVTLGGLIGLVGYYKPSKLMDNLSVGQFNKAVENPATPFDWISHDMVIVNKYANDPMCGYAYNAAFYKELSRGMLDANSDSHMSQFPKIAALIISGLEDPCGELGEGVKKIAAKYRQKGVRITTKLMKHMRHEVLNENHREETYKEVLNFLDNL